MASGNVGLRVSLGLALIALIMVAIAENARIPVDNPATHLELTMVHEAMVLEYSARHLALIELAASLKLLLYISLIACVFVPWGLAPRGRRMDRLCDRRCRLPRQARGRRLPARGLRDLDRQDARVPRAAVPRRGADARPARDAAALRVGRAVSCAALPSTFRTCWPVRWCWSASCCSIRTGSIRCSTSSRCMPSCFRSPLRGRHSSRTRRISISPR